MRHLERDCDNGVALIQCTFVFNDNPAMSHEKTKGRVGKQVMGTKEDKQKCLSEITRNGTSACLHFLEAPALCVPATRVDQDIQLPRPTTL